MQRLGIVTGVGGAMRLAPGVVRRPAVSFVPWGRLPNRRVPDEPIPDLCPDLAVDVLRDSNTPAEMARKRRDYFAAGTRLVWQIDRRTRTAEVFTAPDRSTTLGAAGVLDGGDVLPGFTLPLADLFAELDEQAP